MRGKKLCDYVGDMTGHHGVLTSRSSYGPRRLSAACGSLSSEKQ